MTVVSSRGCLALRTSIGPGPAHNRAGGFPTVVLSPAVRTSGIFVVADLLRCGRRVLTRPVNRDCHVCQLNSVGRLVSASTAGFFVRSKHRFSVPTWVRRGAARSRGQDWPERRRAGHRRRRARSGLDGGEHGARLGPGLGRAHAACRGALFRCSAKFCEPVVTGVDRQRPHQSPPDTIGLLSLAASAGRCGRSPR